MRFPCFLLLALLPLALTGQQEGAHSGVLVRFTAFAGASLADGYQLAAATGEVSRSFDLPNNGFSVPVEVPGPRGEAVGLGRFETGAGGEPAFKALATLDIPEAGRRFIGIVVPAGGDRLRILLLRADDPSFRPGNVMILNFSSQLMAGDLGGRKLRFEPGSRTIFTPRRQQDGPVNYQVQLYHARDGEVKRFAATLWPYFEDKRAYVFLYVNPGNGRPSYRSVDEFTEWLGAFPAPPEGG